MSAGRAWRTFVSARFTVALLCLFALLLLLNVAVPQVAVLGEARFEELIGQSSVRRWFLDTLRFGRLSTSPLFVGVLALFLVNLAAVIGARLGPTWRRVQLRPRKEEGLRSWARMEESRSRPLPPGWGPAVVVHALTGFGYQVRRVGERTFWGVRHRLAPLGFLLFHLSFFLLFAGGAAIYYSRFVGLYALAEGQSFEGAYRQILRSPPFGVPPVPRFTLERAEARLEAGSPVHLGATFRFERSGSVSRLEARVNRPAQWGRISVLVQEAGLAPVFWLQDRGGFTVDRVAALVRTRGGLPTAVPLEDGALEVTVLPLGRGQPFPERDELPETRLRVTVSRGGEPLFDGELAPGEAALVGERRVVLETLRYWVAGAIVVERGGGLLIAGFAIGLVGLVWRLLWFRREIALDWDEERFWLVGRSEFYTVRFRRELEAIVGQLVAGGGDTGPRQARATIEEAT